MASFALDFFRRRALPGVEEPIPGGLRRSLRVGPDLKVVDIVPDGHAATDPRVARALDLGADTTAIEEVLGADPALSPVVERHPDVRVPGAFDPTETAVRAVIGQQVSVTGATTIAGRVVERVGPRLAEPVGKVTHAFPDAATIARADLDGIGMPSARIRTINHVSKAIADGSIELTSDSTSLHARLIELPGIGDWTASYICMRTTDDRDVFLSGDLGVRKGAATLGLPSDARGLREYAERWRPFRSYAVMYLWQAAQG